MRSEESASFGGLVCVLFLLMSMLVVAVIPDRSTAYIPHDPIYIIDDMDFTAGNGVTGGNGTWNDPFIIEGWEINASMALGTRPGIFIANTNAHFAVRNVLVRDGNVTHDGLRLTSAANGTIENSVLMYNSNGIELDGSTNITIRNNEIILNNEPGIRFWESTNNSISGNNISGNDQGMILLRSHDNAITGNNFSWNTNGIFLYTRAKRNVISGNFIFDNNHNGIYVDDFEIEHNTIERNEIFRNSWQGIYNIASLNSFLKNRIYWNTNSGMWFEAGSGNVIVGNEIFDNGAGIRVDVGPNTIAFNLIYLNSGTGVLVWSSDGNAIVANNISSHQFGLDIGLSEWNTVVGNTVSNNSLGIRILYEGNNTIHHNNIIGNSQQAADDTGGLNHWDDGYPSGGNYWSDYVGLDNKSGPNQDLPGSDGIGDTPYDIPAGLNKDRYPLTDPYKASRLIPPSAPTASLSGREFENVTISWQLSGLDIPGLERIVRYDLYRNTTYSPQAEDYQLLGSVEAGVDVFVDNSSGEGDSQNYFYVVCAIELDGNSSCASGQAAKFTRPLAPGPSLVSVPLIQSDENVETVLQTVKYERAWYYDHSSQEWKWYMKDKTYSGGLSGLNHTMGIWANVTQASNLTVAGIVPAQTAIQLRTGWNLISFPSTNTSYTVTDLKAETGATRVEGYGSAPPYFLRVLGDADMLQAGQGYWVKVEADGVWTVSFA